MCCSRRLPSTRRRSRDGRRGRWHYFREGLVGEAAIGKSPDGTYAIRGDTVAGNRTAHTCGIEHDRGQLRANILSWPDEISECRVTMAFTGDAAIVKYKCAGGSNPDCGVAAAWDGIWVRAP